MVYAYPSNSCFFMNSKACAKKKCMSSEAKSIRDYYDSHDISIVRDKDTGKLIAKVEKR